MKTADMERFRLAVDEDPREKRALESMKSHKWFSGFYLRYTNTDTLCLNLDNTRDYAFPGIGVNIFSAQNAGSFCKKQNADYPEMRMHGQSSVISTMQIEISGAGEPYNYAAAVHDNRAPGTGCTFV